MASFIAKFVGKKILGETLENRFGKEDPYFEQVPATRLDGKPSKRTKKQKKALPPGISEHDGQVLTKVKRRAYRLDSCLFSFMGIKFGWGSAIGLIPAIGDVLDMLLALMVMKSCGQIEDGLPMSIRIKMLANIVFDFVVGIVPFVGDILDAGFRANTRNVILLENHLREKGKKELRKSGLPMPAVDPSSPTEFDRAQNELTPAATAESAGPSHRTAGSTPVSPAQPSPAAVRVQSKRDYLGRNRTRESDVEMGQVDPTLTATSKKSAKSGRSGRH